MTLSKTEIKIHVASIVDWYGQIGRGSQVDTERGDGIVSGISGQECKTYHAEGQCEMIQSIDELGVKDSKRMEMK